MLSTKTRTAIIALIASASFAGATLAAGATAPIASAQPREGQSHEERCQELHENYRVLAAWGIEEYFQGGNKARGLALMDAAEGAKAEAGREGCSWALSIHVAASTHTRVVGAVR